MFESPLKQQSLEVTQIMLTGSHRVFSRARFSEAVFGTFWSVTHHRTIRSAQFPAPGFNTAALRGPVPSKRRRGRVAVGSPMTYRGCSQNVCAVGPQLPQQC